MTAESWDQLSTSPYARVRDRVHLNTCGYVTRSKRPVPWLWAKDMDIHAVREQVTSETSELTLCKACFPAATQ